MNKRLLARRIILAIIFVKLFLFTGTSLLGQWAERPGPLASPVILLIEPGSSLRTISQQLARAQVVRSPWLFYYYVRLLNRKAVLQAGEYEFPPQLPAAGVFQLLQEGKTVQHRVTFPEGYTTAEYLTIIREEPALSGQIDHSPSEGTLLPETYFFRRGEGRTALITRMQSAMHDTLQRYWQERAPDLPLSTPYEALILASIVEKETGLTEERPRVAAVFINRLRRHMKLQADPTVAYGITLGSHPLERPLTATDLQTPSPYNTYLLVGLPPGPIANPGAASLHAVLNPTSTDELYFVVDARGGHRFASTLAEHNANVKAYRKWLHEQAKQTGPVTSIRQAPFRVSCGLQNY